MPATVVFLGYADCQLLDVAGPWQVFASANLLAGRALYRTHLLADAVGPVATNGLLRIEADLDWCARDALGPVDTFLVAGGSGVFERYAEPASLERLRAEGDRVRRLGAVCTGAFLLAAAGLLDGRRATTHWRHAPRLAAEFPAVRVEPDALYLESDGRWTSAGVTAGIDLALSMVEADHGPALAGRVARELVMFLHRPGGQSQFSEILEDQGHAGGTLRRLIDRLHADPGAPHDLESMASFAAVTPRHLSRLFRRHLDTTPGAYLTRLRLERARACLSDAGPRALAGAAVRTMAAGRSRAAAPPVPPPLRRLAVGLPRALRRVGRAAHRTSPHRLPHRMNPNVLLLSLCQALLVTGNVLLISVSPLIGATLAPSPAWSTAPVATQWLGLMVATIPASLLMARLGRRRGFVLGHLVGIAGTALAVAALLRESFALFLIATWLIGIGIGVGQLYRFAAVEAAPPSAKDRAIGLVMGGGVLAAFAGPWLSRRSHDAAGVEFVGSFVGLGALYVLALVLLAFVRLPTPRPGAVAGPSRPLREIVAQPMFVRAVVTAIVGYGVMNLAMTATPLAMAAKGYHFDHVATTIQWHVVAMFLPSFFTGGLVARFGPNRIIAAGCALLVGSALVAQTDPGPTGFMVGLVLLGLGWNFTFLPATGLLVETYRPAEKGRAQAANEFLLFSAVSVTALAAGPALQGLGWTTLNACLIPIALVPLRAAARAADGGARRPVVAARAGLAQAGTGSALDTGRPPPRSARRRCIMTTPASSSSAGRNIQYLDGWSSGCSTFTSSWSQSSPASAAGESKATSSIITLPSVSSSVMPAASTRSSPVGSSPIASSATKLIGSPTSFTPLTRTRRSSPAGVFIAASASAAGSRSAYGGDTMSIQKPGRNSVKAISSSAADS